MEGHLVQSNFQFPWKLLAVRRIVFGVMRGQYTYFENVCNLFNLFLLLYIIKKTKIK